MSNEKTTNVNIRLPLTSADVTAEQSKKLRELLPGAFTKIRARFEWSSQALKE